MTGIPRKRLPVPGELFEAEGCPAFRIEPEKQAAGAPWVWYAPTLPTYPGEAERWMFERFLAAGMGIAGVDVGESYGSPEGQASYSAFHRQMTRERGWAERACLLARSRGGLMHYAWATEHAEKVACIAGIYPVCSLASYPRVEKACPAYGLTAGEMMARLRELDPIEHLAPLARAGVPVFHIHGDADEVVPLEANSGELARRYRALGGDVALQVAQGQGHTMWPGFFECDELVEFVIREGRSRRAA